MEEKKVLKTYEEVAQEVQLDEATQKRYIKYMRTRWADKGKEEIQCITGYAMEWAYRFKVGMEFIYSDAWGKRLIRDLAKKELEKMNKEIEDIPGMSSYKV